MEGVAFKVKEKKTMVKELKLLAAFFLRRKQHNLAH